MSTHIDADAYVDAVDLLHRDDETVRDRNSCRDVGELEVLQAILLVAELQSDEAAGERKISHEKARSTAAGTSIHFDTDVIATGGHDEVDIDKVGRLRDRPVQCIDRLGRIRSGSVDIEVAYADVEVVCTLGTFVVAINHNGIIQSTRGSFKSG